MSYLLSRYLTCYLVALIFNNRAINTRQQLRLIHHLTRLVNYWKYYLCLPLFPLLLPRYLRITKLPNYDSLSLTLIMLLIIDISFFSFKSIITYFRSIWLRTNGYLQCGEVMDTLTIFDYFSISLVLYYIFLLLQYFDLVL